MDPTKLDYAKVLGAEGMRHVAVSMKDHGVLKLLISVVMAIHYWLFPTKSELATIVFALVVFDTITGVINAYKHDELSSSGFFRFSIKLVVYYILLATSSLLDRLLIVDLPISAVSLTCGYLSTTEALSILENIAGAGFPVPPWLMIMLRMANNNESTTPEKVVDKQL